MKKEKEFEQRKKTFPLEEEKIKEFFKILKEQAISTVFQPIVSLKTGEILSYEALSRITLPDCTLTIEQLFHMAEHLGQVWNLEKLCRSMALKAASEKPLGAKIFLNVDANVILDHEFVKGFTREFLEMYHLKSQEIVFELTERTSVEDKNIFQDVVRHYKEQGFQIAIDDAGAGYSNLNRISCVEPQYIKIDMELIRNIHKSKGKRSLVGIMARFCAELDYTLIAEGIETKEELETLIQLGVTHGQGYFFKKPAPGFPGLEQDLRETLSQMQQRKPEESPVPSFFGTVETICTTGIIMLPEAKATEAYNCFQEDPNISEICIVNEKGVFCGVLTRTDLLKAFSGMYGYPLHQRFRVADLMKQGTLIVGSDFPIENVSKMAMSRPPMEIYDAVIVLKEKRYFGIVTIKDLLSTAVTIQVKRAADANPLTELPGNITIENRISSLLGETAPYAILYLDLDNFKAYNDAYGFHYGDQMIKSLAASMQSSCSADDFLGHIGGDDFVIITRNSEPDRLAHDIVHTFLNYLPKLYNSSDLSRGYIISKNRSGKKENFPLASISIAIVTNRAEINNTSEQLSEKIVKAKKKAKKHVGNSVVLI